MDVYIIIKLLRYFEDENGRLTSSGSLAQLQPTSGIRHNTHVYTRK